MKTLDIFYDDLTPEAQKEVLEFYEIDCPEDGNFDIVQLATLNREPDEEQDKGRPDEEV